MAPPFGERRSRRERLWWGLAIGVLLLFAFGLRVWGVDHGLPYAYNADENAHFVTRAIGLFGHELEPELLRQPAGLHVPRCTSLLGVWFGGREGVSSAFAADPTRGLGRRAGDRRGARHARGLAALPRRLAARRPPRRPAGGRHLRRRVPAGLLLATRAQRRADAGAAVPRAVGRRGHPALRAHARLRLARASGSAWRARRSTPAGSCCCRWSRPRSCSSPRPAGASRRRARPARSPASCALVAFVVANPYAVLDFAAFWDGLTHQSDAVRRRRRQARPDAGERLSLLPVVVRLGPGLDPAVFAAGGAVRCCGSTSARLVWVLVPGVVLFVLFMGSQERYFGRWLMPVFPFVCLLAAYAALELADWRRALQAGAAADVRRRRGRRALRAGLRLLAAHRAWSCRARTRATWRASGWSPTCRRGTKIVVEPVVPDAWAQDIGNPSPLTSNGNRWVKFPTSARASTPTTRPAAAAGEPAAIVNIEDFERVLVPELVDDFDAAGLLLGRRRLDAARARRGRARARCRRRSPTTASSSGARRSPTRPRRTRRARGPVEFNFDWTFDYYPLAYHRPGPGDDGLPPARAARCAPPFDASVGRYETGAYAAHDALP